MIKKIFKVFQTQGLRGLFDIGLQVAFRMPRASFRNCSRFFVGKGLEIGGPSSIFRRGGLFPVYAVASRVDNCNFGHLTIWEGEISDGETFVFDEQRSPGKQYVAEATDLCNLNTEAYDFVIASHVIEHVANPLRALVEWIRVLKEGGVLLMIVPHKEGTFDHRRPVSSLEHLLDDFSKNVGEGDLTHLDEILSLHDLTMDPGAGGRQVFKSRSLKNFENRALHHHVFDTRLAIDVVNWTGLQIIAVDVFRPFHILLVAQKLGHGCSVENSKFLIGGYFRRCFKSIFFRLFGCLSGHIRLRSLLWALSIGMGLSSSQHRFPLLRMKNRPCVIAVVVTYHPVIATFLSLLEQLMLQTDGVVVVDNSDRQDNRVLDGIPCRYLDSGRLSVACLGENQGVATALNIGIEEAMRGDAQYVLLSDQDSLPDTDMVERLMSVHEHLASQGIRVGAVGPTFLDLHTGQRIPFQALLPSRAFYGEKILFWMNKTLRC